MKRLTKVQKRVLQLLAAGCTISGSWNPYAHIRDLNYCVVGLARCAVIDRLMEAGLVEQGGYSTPKVMLTEAGKAAAA